MTYAIQMLELSDAQLASLAFAAPFLTVCFIFGLGAVTWGK